VTAAAVAATDEELESEASENSNFTCTFEVLVINDVWFAAAAATDIEEHEDVAVDSDVVVDTVASPPPPAASLIDIKAKLSLFIVRSLGLFWELVGVSHEFESEWAPPALLLETCFLASL
jgi:hypothetical protein